MDNAEMNRELEQLHESLARVEHVDDASRARLELVVEEIRKVLDAESGDVSGHHRNLLERLRESAEHFKASHPGLVETVNRAIATLSDVGI